MLLTAVDVSEAAGDRLQQGLGIGHVVVAVEGTLCGDIRESDDRPPFVDGVLLAGDLNGLVEGDGRNIERLGQVVVVEVIVGAALADVGRHADRVEHEVELATEVLHGLVDEVFEVLDAGSVCRDDDRIAFFSQLADGSHADRYGGIGEDDFGTLFHGAFGHFPGYGLLVQGSEDKSLLSFQ